MKNIIMTILLLSTVLFAQVKVGDNFPHLTLVDPFDKKVQVNKNAKIFLSFEKDVSSGIKSFLDTKEKNYLTKNNILYISDISAMPSLITSWFALPKMKKFSFQIALIYDEKEGKVFSKKEKKVTVITLKNNVITSIQFIAPAELAKNNL